ncbi:protein of unknown function [Cyanobium sp. NIES-981]|nr:protein of unknown function [Cyanobium sp. NIES-981]
MAEPRLRQTADDLAKDGELTQGISDQQIGGQRQGALVGKPRQQNLPVPPIDHRILEVDIDVAEAKLCRDPSIEFTHGPADRAVMRAVFEKIQLFHRARPDTGRRTTRPSRRHLLGVAIWASPSGRQFRGVAEGQGNQMPKPCDPAAGEHQLEPLSRSALGQERPGDCPIPFDSTVARLPSDPGQRKGC